MRKPTDNNAAKLKRQKKIVIGGVVLLVAVLAFEGPKVLKGLHNKPVTDRTAAAPSSQDVSGGASTSAGGTGENTPPADATQPAAPVTAVTPGASKLPPDPDPAPALEDGQLVSFSLFKSRDPFVQQLGSQSASSSGGSSSGGSGGSAAPTTGPAPTSPPPSTPPAATPPTATPTTPTKPTTPTPTPTPKPTTPSTPTTPTTTTPASPPPPPAPTPTTTTPTTTAQRPQVPAPTATLKPGDTGTQVAALQRALASLGFSSGKADGDYGPATTQAVTRFQRAKGLTADGIFGPATLEALRNALRGA